MNLNRTKMNKICFERDEYKQFDPTKYLCHGVESVLYCRQTVLKIHADKISVFYCTATGALVFFSFGLFCFSKITNTISGDVDFDAQ